MKKCPFCAENIQEEAVKCRFCGEWIDIQAMPEIPREDASLSSKQQLVTEKVNTPAEEDEIRAYREKYLKMKAGELYMIQRGYDPKDYLPEARMALEEVFLIRKNELEEEKELSGDMSIGKRDQQINPFVKRYDKVGGWLSWICFALIILNPIYGTISLLTGYKESAPFFDRFSGLRALVWIDGILGIGVILLGMYAGFSLYAIQTKAPRIAKAYLLSLLGYSIIEMLLPGLVPELSQSMENAMAVGLGRTIVLVSVWYAYFTFSKRVKGTYGG